MYWHTHGQLIHAVPHGERIPCSRCAVLHAVSVAPEGDIESSPYGLGHAVQWLRYCAHLRREPCGVSAHSALQCLLSLVRHHAALDASKTRLGTAYDYGTILVEFASGAFGTIRVAHSRYLRKGLSPDMELHGTEGSLGIDRASSTISVVRPGGVPEVIDTVLEIEVNKFAEYAFPGVRERADGTSSEHPGLDDGWRVQLFTNAAVLSAQRGSWVDLAELNPETG